MEERATGQEARDGRDEAREAGGSAEPSESGASSESGSSFSEVSDSDGEELEPLFSYSRVTRLPGTFFHKDAISSVLIHPQVYVFATHSGVVHLAKPDMTPIRTVRTHRASIVDIDSDGSYVATASIDGTVVIMSVADSQDVTPAAFNRPIHSVSLDPNYKHTKCYLSGGTAGTVTKSEKGWLRARKDTVLFECTSTILAIKWHGDKAFWCTDDGITVFDMATSSVVQRVARLPNSPRANLYRPQIRASAVDSRVIVGWGSSIWVLDVEEPEMVVSAFNVEWLISGLAFFHDGILLLCSHVGEEPELRVIDMSGTETYADELSLVDYARLGPNDYHLQGTGPFYLVSAKDGVIARERDVKDHVEWLMGLGHFLDAYHSSKDVCDNDTRKGIGLKAVGKLVELKRWDEAAGLLAEVLDSRGADEWLVWSKTFLDNGQHFAFGDHMPPSLGKLEGVRTDILKHAVANSPAKVLYYLGIWDTASFDAGAVVGDLRSKTEPDLVAARAQIHAATGEPMQAVQDYLEINSDAAFRIASEFHLWSDALSLLAQILQAGDEPSPRVRLRVLVENHLQVPPRRVVDQLVTAKQDQLLFWYLEQLASENELLIQDFGDLLVRLYGEFDRDQLMGFLTRNDNYNLSKAIQVCEAQQYTEELVYLLGRVGQTQKALDLLLNQLNAVERAVEFAAQHDEQELWDSLILHSTSKPELVLRLLRCTQVSPVQVLLKVPETLKIPGLKGALIDIFEKQAAITDLTTGALAIFRSESQSLLSSLQKSRHAGVSVGGDDGHEVADEAIMVQADSVTTVADIEGVSNYFGPVSSFSDKIRHFGHLLALLRTRSVPGAGA